MAMRAATQITDRAKRYRAVKTVTGPKVCVLCGARPKGGRPLDVMHLTGNEAHGEKENLAYGCRSCNGKLAAAFKSIGAGKPTKQYNPSKGVPTFDQYAWAVSSGAREYYPNSTRHARGVKDEAGAIIHATPKHKRVEYARLIAERSRRTKREKADERWNPAEASAEAFEEFHGYAPKELVTVKKRVHHHEHLAAAGDLVGLKVRPIGRGLPVRKIEGLGEAYLAFNESKNQLFIEGGDQSLDKAELKRFGVTTDHELQTLGKLVGVGYYTDKKHLGDEGGEATYSHTFRTTNENGRHVTVKIARYPDLIYRVVEQQFEISGGSYTIRAEGIDV